MKKILSAVIMTAMLASFCACEVTVKPDTDSDTATTTVSNNGAPDGDVSDNGAEVTETTKPVTEAEPVKNIVSLTGIDGSVVKKFELPDNYKVISGDNTSAIVIQHPDYEDMTITIKTGPSPDVVKLNSGNMPNGTIEPDWMLEFDKSMLPESEYLRGQTKGNSSVTYCTAFKGGIVDTVGDVFQVFEDTVVLEPMTIQYVPYKGGDYTVEFIIGETALQDVIFNETDIIYNWNGKWYNPASTAEKSGIASDAFTVITSHVLLDDISVYTEE